MDRTRLPLGVTLADFCEAVRALPVIGQLKASTGTEGGLLGLSCGLGANTWARDRQAAEEHGPDLLAIEVCSSIRIAR